MGNKDDTKAQRKCQTCRGTGWITLLTSRSKCPDCKGTGIRPGGLDPGDEALEFDDDSRTPARGTKIPRP